MGNSRQPLLISNPRLISTYKLHLFFSSFWNEGEKISYIEGKIRKTAKLAAFQNKINCAEDFWRSSNRFCTSRNELQSWKKKNCLPCAEIFRMTTYEVEAPLSAGLLRLLRYYYKRCVQVWSLLEMLGLRPCRLYIIIHRSAGAVTTAWSFMDV